MSQALSTIEREFISYLALRRHTVQATVEAAYLHARGRFGMTGAGYRSLALDLYELFAPAYGHESETDAIAAHQFYSVLHTYKLLARATADPEQYEALADSILALLPDPATVVDYGCGLACTSLALAERWPELTVYLVDVESTMLDFATTRLRWHGVNVTPIAVTAADPYPALPAHDVCLADLVMEELREPLRAYANIHAAMPPGGVLAGRFLDWQPRILRPSPNLSELRQRIAQDYIPAQAGALYVRREAAP